MYGKRNRITLYVSILSSLFIMYYGVVQIIHSTVAPYQHNISYIMDELKLLQPTEKKTYTLCPNNTVYHPMSQLSEVSLTEAEINQVKLKWQNFVLTIPPYSKDKYFGRGIVSSASSNFHSFRRLIASIKLLRWLKCRLPIEVFSYFGELKTEQITEFEKIPNVIIRILRDRKRTFNRYLIKPLAILNSSFEHVLWLDSDNIAVCDPEYLFDLPHYTRSTAMFWPDFWLTPGKNAIWKILDIPCRAEDYEQESGQILINKRLSWKALNLALHLNSDPIILKLVLGDKDTFRLSWKALNTNFYFIRKFVGIAGFYYVESNKKNEPDKKVKFCGHTVIQHNPFGEILFLHTNLVKDYVQMDFPVEKTHFALNNYTSVWRVYRRYANSAPYLKVGLFREKWYLVCTTFLTDDNENMPPMFEDDFHNQVSANITAQYLSYIDGSIIQSPRHADISVLD